MPEKSEIATSAHNISYRLGALKSSDRRQSNLEPTARGVLFFGGLVGAVGVAALFVGIKRIKNSRPK